ncbi:MAG: hypothetical protein WA990_08595 [Rubrobacteraceae bacterium]
MMGGFGTGGGLGIIFLLLIVALVVWVLVRVLPNQGGSNDDSRPDQSSAEDILKDRFARGQIDAEEYEDSLATLRGERTQRGNPPQQ